MPRLSWRLASDRRGDAPVAYRIRVQGPDDVLAWTAAGSTART
ncbi:hypothetical protein [Nonomuraea sp. SYSU D8015]|nr:hypothetical protein [Nonomuraea sp. SYSU D8015]